jgi:hypothetical protein
MFFSLWIMVDHGQTAKKLWRTNSQPSCDKGAQNHFNAWLGKIFGNQYLVK